MTHKLAFCLILFSFVAFNGCGSSSPVVASVGGEKITLEDFENSYAKNNGGWANAASSSFEDRQRFLDLLVKFRLKLQEAKERDLSHDSSVVDELESYRLSVAQTYMLDAEIVQPRIKEVYNHKLEEIHAAHILFRLPQNPTPAETLTAYNKALKVIALIPSVPFDSLAIRYSEEVQTGSRGGDVGWIPVGRVGREIEDGVYALKQGECTKLPVRTQQGYHILKVLQRQRATGAIRISHILRRFSPDLKDSIAVRDTIQRLYRELKRGVDFGALAKNYSDDPGSNQRGGDIGFYERDRLRPDIVKLLYDLPVDSITSPYLQPYGYHIFKITGRRTPPAFEEIEKDLRTEYQQTYYQQDYAEYVRNLKKFYAVKVDDGVGKRLRVSFDTTKTPNSEGWSDTLSRDFLKRTLMICGGKNFTVKDFVNGVNASMDFRMTELKPANVDNIVDHFTETEALKEHARKAPDRYPTLRNLMDEYLDGILLYRIEQDEIWKKVVVNDSLLRIYYGKTKEKYRWPERVNFAEIFVTSDSATKAVNWKLAYGEDFLSVAEEYTARSGYRDKLGIWGFQTYGLNELSQKASAMAVDSVSTFLPFQNGWSMIKVIAKDTAHVKTFEEAAPELTSSYQEEASKLREQEWIGSLRQKFGVSVKNELLTQAFKNKPLEKK